MIGETISHYRIIEQLGEGGMGVVYRAEDINLRRSVAIKFLTSTAPEYRARFLREAQAVSLLNHQNIAAVFDYGETPKGQPYIVMELIKGEPLSQKLQGGSLPLPEAARIVCSIAEALGEAHLQGVVHRDIKPSNVIINERGQVKVVDFGLVKQILEGALDATNDKRVGTETRSDVIVGTPLYLSPEQATGKTVDRRSDLFALGAVLYECLTGESAFSGDSLMEIGAQVIHVTPPAPSKLNEHVPSALDRITMKAMEKNIEARYQSADELIADLRAVLPSLKADGFRKRGRSTHPAAPARTHSTSALTTLSETLRQPRLSWGAVVIAVLALGLVVGGLIWWRRPVPYKPTAAALEFYNTGTEAVRNGEFLQASRALQEATRTDPQFALAHARLAEAWFELDYQDKATNETLNAQRLVPNRSELPVVDALYLDAINATATRNFAGAINAYSEIVRLSPDEPHLYVDLGRAYEKNDEPKRAIESYLAAIARSPRNPTPHLRLGVLYDNQVDLPKAMASFDTAQQLFEALGKFEGQAEVAFQRGALFDKQRKPALARPHLERALELAKTTGSNYQEVKTLLTLGNGAVDENKFEQARSLIQQAIDKAKADGIDRFVKRGFVDMGNLFLVSGDYREAEKYYRLSLELAQNQKDNRNAARALLALGSVLQKQSKIAEAVSSIEQALPFYQQAGYRREAMQALALWARAKYQQGDYTTALQASEKQLELAHQLGESVQELLAQEDIGYALAAQSKYPDALKHFEESHALAKALGGKKNIALGFIHRADILWSLGHYDEARKLMADAAPIAESADASKSLAAGFYLSSAKMALSERNWSEAIEKALRASALADAGARAIAIGAMSTGGLAQIYAGASSKGQLDCEQAVRTAQETTDPRLIANSLATLAEANLHSGKTVEALQAGLEAAETFSRLGTLDSEWIAWSITARASQNAGQTQKAKEYAERAQTALASLEQLWGGDYYNSYLNRQDIQFYRKWLSGIR